MKPHPPNGNKNNVISAKQLAQNTLMFQEMIKGNWKAASAYYTPLFPIDFNGNMVYLDTVKMRQKVNHIPMPEIDKRTTASTLESLIAAPFQIVAALASRLGPDYVTVSLQAKDTLCVPYFYFSSFHYTKDPADAMNFYLFLVKNGWDVSSFLYRLNENKVSRNLPSFTRSMGEDSIQHFMEADFSASLHPDEEVLRNIMLMSVIAGDTCTLERLLYHKWYNAGKEIAPHYDVRKFLSSKVKTTHAQYILNYPIQVAVYKNDMEATKILLAYGANPNVLTNSKGKDIFFGIGKEKGGDNYRKEKTCLMIAQTTEMKNLIEKYGGKTVFALKMERVWKRVKKLFGF